jgi:hypothetical protein
MNLQEQISRIKSMMMLNENTTYQIYVDMGGVLFPSSSNDQVQAGTTEKPTDVKGFQSWVINTKKDNQILGKYGADGKWGKNTSNAWVKYGEEYKKLNPTAKTTSANSQSFIGSSLWNYIKNQNPFILTSVGNDGNTEQKKQNKLKQTANFLGIPNDRVLFVTNGTDKAQYSGQNKILIDDSPKNTQAWTGKGGVGIEHKNNDETIKMLSQYLQPQV